MDNAESEEKRFKGEKDVEEANGIGIKDHH